MTLNDITQDAMNRSDSAIDAAYELAMGQRPIEIIENHGEDWKEYPALLVVDELKIKLTANKLDSLINQGGFTLQDHVLKLQATGHFQDGSEPEGFGTTAHAAALVDEPEMNDALQIDILQPCVDCGTTIGVTLGPCPYASEIDNDYTPICLCEKCADERAMDI